MKNTAFTHTLQGKALKHEQALTKRAVRESLRDYSAALDGAVRRVACGESKRSRDVINAMKGKFAVLASQEITELVAAGKIDARGARLYVAAYMVAKCYPWQAENGALLCKRKSDDGRVWSEQRLTKGSADAILRRSIDNFIMSEGEPSIEYYSIGQAVE